MSYRGSHVFIPLYRPLDQIWGIRGLVWGVEASEVHSVPICMHTPILPQSPMLCLLLIQVQVYDSKKAYVQSFVSSVLSHKTV